MPVRRAAEALDDGIQERRPLVHVDSAAELAAPDAVVAEISDVVLGGIVLDLELGAAASDHVKPCSELEAVRGGTEQSDYGDTS